MVMAFPVLLVFKRLLPVGWKDLLSFWGSVPAATQGGLQTKRLSQPAGICASSVTIAYGRMQKVPMCHARVPGLDSGRHAGWKTVAWSLYLALCCATRGVIMLAVLVVHADVGAIAQVLDLGKARVCLQSMVMAFLVAMMACNRSPSELFCPGLLPEGSVSERPCLFIWNLPFLI